MKPAAISIVGLVILTTCFAAAWAEEEMQPASQPAIIAAPTAQKKPLVQMAILLDTSGSMEGLINQARTELWAIVNEFIFAKQNGQQPELQVALYEYGKQSLAQKDGYIRQIVPFTTDLDKVSEELFALKTNGGDEYCGWVIKEATEKLSWNTSPDDLKVIFIAGNEPFTQGPIDYRQSCKAAIAKGIVVNTIHCGPEPTGIDTHWKDGANLADGRFLNIDQNRQIVHIEAPQDKLIAELSNKLNDTYIAYGARGSDLKQRQVAQDRNAGMVSREAALQRTVAKSSANYRNDSWDLVDAIRNNKAKLEDMTESELPEEMRKMTPEQRKAHIESKVKQRAEIQQKIQHLNVQREKHIAAEMMRLQGKPDTLGSAITKAVRDQAQKKNYTFEKPNEPKDTAEQPKAPTE
jgi:hypothetical protein